jgi:hypothetical protein
VKRRATYPVLVLLKKLNQKSDSLDTKAKLGAEEKAELPTPAHRPEPMTPKDFQMWKRMNWLRCRCEYDDLFDMCLNCITHRQANDLVN